MNKIEKFFLRAQHWKIFSLFAVAFVVAEVVTIDFFTAHASLTGTGRLGTHGMLLGAVNALVILCFLAWLWALGTFLNSITQSPFRLRTTFFRIAIIYPFFYSFAVVPLFLDPDGSKIAIILPLHFFAMFCLFYDLRFASKSLALAEMGRPVSFYDYAGPFFLIWFFPIGIWFIQPRVNQLYADRRNAAPSA